MVLFDVILALNRVTLSSPITTNLIRRNISTSLPAQFRATPVLLAEPLKKKKRIDPAIIRAREERKKRKIEREIRRLEKSARQLKPIEECEVPLEVRDSKEKVTRIIPKISPEVMDQRDLLQKKWAVYKRQQHLADLQMMDRIVFAQQKALDELRKESQELYDAAIQPDFHLLPFTSQGPLETPPLKDYEVPDGDYQDVSKKW